MATSTKTIADRLHAARKNMKNPPMSGTGQIGSRKYPYSTLADVLGVILPALDAEGLFLTQGIADGELVTSVYNGTDTAILDRRLINQDGTPQEKGSAETYARRYALCTIFCLVGDTDDDGAAASAKPRNADALQAAKERVWAALTAAMDKEQAKEKVDEIKTRDDFDDTPEFWSRIAYAYEEH